MKKQATLPKKAREKPLHIDQPFEQAVKTLFSNKAKKTTKKK